MTSPLTAFTNAKILFSAPGARSSGRDGFKQLPGQSYLIKAFIKRGAKDVADRLQLPAVEGAPMEFHGYCISHAPITSAQLDDFPSVDETGLAFDTSMILPPEVSRDSRGKLFVSGLGLIDVRFVAIAGDYGNEGVGEIVRGALGDSIHLEGGQVG